MFHATMAAAIDGARTLAQMDELSRQIWQAHVSGAVDDAGAQRLAKRLHERRGNIIQAGIVPVANCLTWEWSAFVACRSAFQSLDEPDQVGRWRIVQLVGINPRQIPRDGVLQGAVSELPVAAVSRVRPYRPPETRRFAPVM